MKKLTFTLLSFLFISLFAKSQLQIAVAGGGHTASVIETNDLPGWDSVKNNYLSRKGFHVGIMADLRFTPRSKFYFQPGVIFYNKGRKYKMHDSAGIIS